ncbi:hypothetical protein J6524_34640 [Bradyrhizobium sp. WSM 1738]|uniref:hypothetical protein n=1 Tax=Bradyrhizobium hereditatis TaxID=2821405 RepID=UPI001CE2D2D8|nr:hypothetical protein [Bradyrhizobium hereditatis]MCA6119967.1 hypothetical protein [Bradyrhizobium hereditatis]
MLLEEGLNAGLSTAGGGLRLWDRNARSSPGKMGEIADQQRRSSLKICKILKAKLLLVERRRF